ncbi:MAG: hypothetical protein FWB98_07230 [Defluviitaleaceae bacterium]|nr:hypothetical protein [Defluviitaleaceae bacterium]
MIIEKALELRIKMVVLPLEVLQHAKADFAELAEENELSDYQKDVLSRLVTDVPEDMDFVPKSIVLAIWNSKNMEDYVDTEKLFAQMGVTFLNVRYMPKKYLAARSGMGVYGINNSIFVDGWGSLGRIGTWFTNIEPPEEYTWQESEISKACDNCSKCLTACPGGIGVEGRFLIDASKCINIGKKIKVCSICQTVCPVNEKLTLW